MSKKLLSLVDKTGDSRHWDAVQCLTDLLEEIKAGKIKPEKLAILAWELNDNGRYKKTTYSVNFTMAEFVAYMAAAAADALSDWRKE